MSVATGAAPLPIAGALLDRLLAPLREPEWSGTRAPWDGPLNVQRPSLRHFRPEAVETGAANSASQPARHGDRFKAGRSASGSAGTAARLAAIAALALTGLIVVLLSSRPERTIRGALRQTMAQFTTRPARARRLRRPALAAAAGLSLLPAMAVGAQLRSTPAASRAQLISGTVVWAHPPVDTRSVVGGHLSSAVADPAPARAHPAWAQLVSIESQVSADQVQLVSQERAVRSITALVSRLTPPSEDAHPAVITFRSLVASRFAEATARRQATEHHYEQIIQAEYNLFRTAAPAAEMRAVLLAAAAEQASPEVRAAIAYNLSAVQTQLAQEATITAAEARLQLLRAAGPSRPDTLPRHQALLAPEFGVVTQPFGPTEFGMEGPLTYRGVTSAHFHWGLDIGCALDTPVHAAADGVVVLATSSLDANGGLVGYGNHVVIAHPDGLVTLYAHLNSLKVQAGDVVRQGAVIGLEGSTGWSTGPHLHFEVRRGSELLDPRPLLGNQLPA